MQRVCNSFFHISLVLRNVRLCVFLVAECLQGLSNRCEGNPGWAFLIAGCLQFSLVTMFFVYFVDMCNALCIVILTKNFCAKLGFLHFCQYIISSDLQTRSVQLYCLWQCDFIVFTYVRELSLLFWVQFILYSLSGVLGGVHVFQRGSGVWCGWSSRFETHAGRRRIAWFHHWVVWYEEFVLDNLYFWWKYIVVYTVYLCFVQIKSK